MITSQQLVVRRKYHSRSHLSETIVAKGLCALVNWPSVGCVVEATLIWYGGDAAVDDSAT